MTYILLIIIIFTVSTSSSQHTPDLQNEFIEATNHIKTRDNEIKIEASTKTDKETSSQSDGMLDGKEGKIVVEYARDRPLMFGGNYDLVSEWTGRRGGKEMGGLNGFPRPYHYHQHPEFYSVEGMELDVPYNEGESHLRAGADNQGGTSSDDGREILKFNSDKMEEIFLDNGEKTPKKRGHSLNNPRGSRKRGGKRRHVGPSQHGERWKVQWSGEGIFRGVSKCVDIPRNMSLCNNIDYKIMRVPNLLQHDSLREIVEQSSYWTPLTRLNCHRDVQIFLCSLFAPVCLEKPVYPCRRTCEAVKNGCEAPMKQYNFGWPEFLDCSNFPADTDLCVGLREEGEGEGVSSEPARSSYRHECNMCGADLNVETFIDHYCEADVVLKTRLHSVKAIKRNHFFIRIKDSGLRFMKGARLGKELAGRRRERMALQTDNCNCTQVVHDLRKYVRKAPRKNKPPRKPRRIRGTYNQTDSDNKNMDKKSVKKNRLSMRPAVLKSSMSSSSRRSRKRYLLMGRRLSGRWVVMFIQALDRHSTVARQALHVIHSNHRNICSSVG